MPAIMEETRGEPDTGRKRKYSLQREITHFLNNQSQSVSLALGESSLRVEKFGNVFLQLTTESIS